MIFLSGVATGGGSGGSLSLGYKGSCKEEEEEEGMEVERGGIGGVQEEWEGGSGLDMIITHCLRV